MEFLSKKMLFNCLGLLFSPCLYSSESSLTQLAHQAHQAHQSNNQTEYFVIMQQLRHNPAAKKSLHKVADAQTAKQIESAIALGLLNNDDQSYDKHECFYGATRHLKQFAGKTGHFNPQYPISTEILFRVYTICQHQEIDKLKLGKSSK